MLITTCRENQVGCRDIEAVGKVFPKLETSIYGETGDAIQIQSVLSLVLSNFPVVLEGNTFKGNSGTKGVILLTSDVSEDGPNKSRNIIKNQNSQLFFTQICFLKIQDLWVQMWFLWNWKTLKWRRKWTHPTFSDAQVSENSNWIRCWFVQQHFPQKHWGTHPNKRNIPQLLPSSHFRIQLPLPETHFWIQWLHRGSPSWRRL